MRVLFEGLVLVNGRPIDQATIADGEELRCVVVGDGVHTALLTFREGKLVGDGLSVEDWSEVAIAKVPKECATPRAIRQETQVIAAQSYTVTAVCEYARTTVWVDGIGFTRMYWMPKADNVQIVFAKPMSAVAIGAERAGQTYLMLVDLYEGDVLYEGWVDEYAADERLTVKCTYRDMKRHTRHSIFGYKEGKFCMIEQSFSCAYRHTYISALMPYLFMEALAVGDRQEAMGYLSQELQEDYDALLSYIGEVREVRRPPRACEVTEVGVVDEEGKGKVFACEMQNIIVDVRRVE